tara:strand:+ start:215 stop:1024 length:810 start_codon:yes stop_codon:yes gene_type:complete
MKIFFNKKKLIKEIQNTENLGFVPTMGAIHKGHLSLIKKSKKLSRKTIVSIFINKPQFNNKNDFKKYPRSIKKDINLLKKNKIDYLYLPSTKEIYPQGKNKKIKISKWKKILCGKNRRGHFEAVVDVVDRFIKIIKPKKIYLGEKDFQQFAIIREFIIKNNIKTKPIICPTIREKNGIAFSSRNSRLNKKERIVAANVYKIVKKNRNKILKNNFYIKKIKKILLSVGVKKIDYLEVFDTKKILDKKIKKKKFKIFLAYYIKKVRLIDNF